MALNSFRAVSRENNYINLFKLQSYWVSEKRPKVARKLRSIAHIFLASAFGLMFAHSQRTFIADLLTQNFHEIQHTQYHCNVNQLKLKVMNQTKLNHQIWMLANAIQALSHVNDSSNGMEWLENAIEDIEEVLNDLKKELPF